jgi:hypothetical protein
MKRSLTETTRNKPGGILTEKENLIVTGLLVAVIFLGFVFGPGSPLSINLAWAADAYGQDIEWIHVVQYNGTAWNLVKNFTATAGSERILAGYQVNFTVAVRLNYTFAGSSSDASSFSRVNATISTGGTPLSGWSNVPCNQTVTPTQNGTYWYVWFYANWTSPTPVGGNTYNCTFLYQAYF